MRLLHEARRVNVVVQHRERAETMRLRRSSDPRRSQQVGRSVRAWRVRPAHRPGNHYRLLSADQQVEDKGGLFYRVRALDDDGAVKAGCEAFLDHPGDFDQIAGGEGGAGQAERRARVDLRHLRERQHRSHQLGGAEFRRDAAGIVRYHGDRPTEGQDEQTRLGHGAAPSSTITTSVPLVRPESRRVCSPAAGRPG